MSSQTLSKAHRMSYRIGRGETGVLTFEPYKSEILPLWRFKTPAIARHSSQQIYSKFLEYDEQDDFVGMDMCRKFLQMVCVTCLGIFNVPRLGSCISTECMTVSAIRADDNTGYDKSETVCESCWWEKVQ